MHWILLILSGSLEAVWAHALSDILRPRRMRSSSCWG